MPVNTELLKGTLTTLVCQALSQRDMYGYDLIKELERLSAGEISPKEGSLYPLLHLLEKEKSVESYWVENTGERKRKYYRLTEAGKKRLTEKTKEWEAFRAMIDRALLGLKQAS